MVANDLEQSAEQILLLMERIQQIGPQNPPPNEAGISPSQLSLITFLASNPGCGVQVMASGLKLSKSTVSIGVNVLEEAGLITRQPDPDDGRAVQLYLTPNGQALHQRTHEFLCEKFESLLTGLTPQERTTLISLLERALQTIEKKKKEK